MKKHLQRFHSNLKAKPEHERRRFSLQASAGLMAVVLVAWVSTLGVRLANANLAPAQDSGTQSLLASVDAASGGIQDQFSQMRSAISSVGAFANASTTAAQNIPVTQNAAAPAESLYGAPVTDDSSSSASTSASWQGSMNDYTTSQYDYTAQ